jgi:phage-related protein
VFDINFAFDNLNDKGLRALKRWLNYEDIAELWFAEEPYKVYSAKVASQPSL